jgi:hypothetical protein
MGWKFAKAYVFCMTKTYAFALLIFGTVLLHYGLNAGVAVLADSADAIAGRMGNKSLVLIAAGLSGMAVGAMSTFLRRPN